MWNICGVLYVPLHVASLNYQDRSNTYKRLTPPQNVVKTNFPYLFACNYYWKFQIVINRGWNSSILLKVNLIMEKNKIFYIMNTMKCINCKLSSEKISSTSVNTELSWILGVRPILGIAIFSTFFFKFFKWLYSSTEIYFLKPKCLKKMNRFSLLVRIL